MDSVSNPELMPENLIPDVGPEKLMLFLRFAPLPAGWRMDSVRDYRLDLGDSLAEGCKLVT